MKESTTRTLRTLVQGAVALAAAAPMLLTAAGVPEHTAGVAIFLAVAGAITRIMALPMIDTLLPGWLRSRDPGPDADPAPDPSSGPIGIRTAGPTPGTDSREAS
ncbi:hypothetical protein OG948_12335 [Embleya sp. NBC_00888]|uniref:hypothetical protein n=1 Tax=Embleya sp. NBC_00888 TaxID=2975960 RepID=UPI003867A627|nr:hypothetical protein OG948_12335 [Embleya sp. NBC_00888]